MEDESTSIANVVRNYSRFLLYELDNEDIDLGNVKDLIGVLKNHLPNEVYNTIKTDVNAYIKNIQDGFYEEAKMRMNEYILFDLKEIV